MDDVPALPSLGMSLVVVFASDGSTHGSGSTVPAGAEDRLMFMINRFRATPTHASGADP